MSERHFLEIVALQNIRELLEYRLKSSHKSDGLFPMRAPLQLTAAALCVEYRYILYQLLICWILYFVETYRWIRYKISILDLNFAGWSNVIAELFKFSVYLKTLIFC